MEYKYLSISFIVSALAILVLSLVHPYNVGAQYYQQGETKKILSVDKKVRSIKDAAYENNIESSKRVFFEGDVLEFSIAIENTGNNALNNIKVTDNLPANLSLIFYPGVYEKNSNTITWTIDKLNTAEIKTFLIRAKVVDVKSLNISGSNTVKMTNFAEAKTDNISDKDDASYFVGASTIPKTGNSSLPIQTVIVISSCAAGFALRKFARGY